MKQDLLRISVASFLLFFGKALFDIKIFADFFQLYHSTGNLAIFFGNAGMFGLVMILIFNHLQRAFHYGISITYTYILLFASLAFSFYYYTFSGYTEHLAFLASFNIPLNLTIMLAMRGLLVRTEENEMKKNEKGSNLGSNIGILLAGTVSVLLFHYFENYANTATIHLVSLLAIISSIIVITTLFKNNKKVNAILDNLQAIRTSQNIFKLLFTRYFTTILITTAIAAFIMVSVSSLYIKINLVKYTTSSQLINLFSISVIIFTAMSIFFEIFFKEKTFYSLGIKINLLLLPLVVLVFCVILALTSFYFEITPGSEFFFFIPMIATLYLIFTHFSFFNIFYPVINTLYLPLNNQNQNDYYIKSSFLGFFIGIGFASLAIYRFIPKLNLANNGEYIVFNIILIVFLMLVNRLLVYPNYKKALHKRLDIEERTSMSQHSFINNIINRIKDFSGIRIVRIINLLYLINPVKSKKILNSLIVSDEPVTQRAGLVSSNKLYLLETYEKMKEISQTKYFASSPNRDKIEQLMSRFEEVQSKMQKTNYIKQLSISKKDIERVYGGMLALYAPKKHQAEILNRLVKDPELPVAKSAIISSAGIKDPDTIKAIIERLEIAELSNAAYASLLSIDQEHIQILEDTFYQTGQSEKVQIKIVRLLGDIATTKAVEYLLKKLNYPNQNIISAALKALSKCNITLPDKKAMIIKHELDEVCKYLIWNTSLHIDLKQQKASKLLLEAMDVEIEYNYKTMFDLLALLYNPGSIELIRKNLHSHDYEKVNFALELASVVLKDEMKPMILPLIRPLSKEERIKRMQTFFTTEKMDISDILYDIIQREFKWINPWTKACAIMDVSRLNQKEDVSILLANMVNPDPMLSELSALSVFSIDKKTYFENKEILGNDFKNIIGETAIKAIEASNEQEEDHMPVLKFEIIRYLQKIEEFSDIPGEILKYLTDGVYPLNFSEGEQIEKIDNLDIYNYHYIIYSGKVNLFINNNWVKSFEKDTLLSSVDLLIDYEAEIKLIADSDVALYKINPSEFADNLNLYDEIPFSIVENTQVKKMAAYEKALKNEKIFKKKLPVNKKLLTPVI
jgi:hypothetical protein